MQAWERDGLSSNPQHRKSRWYTSINSEWPNIDSVMLWMRQDTSICNGVRSLERYDAERWVRDHLANANADGSLQPPPLPSLFRATNQIRRTDLVQSGPQWRNVGPFTWDREAAKATASEGIGVIRSIAVNPQSPDTLLVGTISAGAWWTGDGGDHWQAVTDHLMGQQADDVAFAPSNPSIAYAALDVGLARSTDGGRTFVMTSWDSRSTYPATTPVDHISVSAQDPDHLIIATNGQLMSSSDGGQNWQSIPESEGRYWSVRHHPTNPAVVYAVSYSGNISTFRVFTPQGLRYATGLPNVTGNGITPRALIATSIAAPSCVWLLYGGKVDTIGGVWGLYRSCDSGRTFTSVCCGIKDGPELPTELQPNLFDYDPGGQGLGQITWDMAFTVSNTDTNHLVAAGIFPYVSRDGGRSWAGMKGIHYDVQDAVIMNGTTWIATDGGLVKTQDDGVTMTDRSDGICAVEVWGFGQSHGTEVMAIGAYHLPVFLRDDDLYDHRGYPGGWAPWSGADAMMADVHPDDDSWVYAKPWSSVRGQRSKSRTILPTSRELGIDLGYLPFSNVAFHPQQMFTILAADHSIPAVVRTEDNAENWTVLKTFSSSITHVRYAPSNPTVMAVLADARLWRSDNDGRDWADITPSPAITSNRRIIDVAFAPEDESTLWIAFSGSQQDVKVLRTTDAGRSWIDCSNGLLHEATYCLVHQRGSSNGVFAGTARGVYQWSEGDRRWYPYGTGLPTCHVRFLHVDDINGMLRAGTSRGIWEVVAPVPERLVASASVSTDTLRCYNSEVEFSDRSNVLETVRSWRVWSFPGGEPNTSTLPKPRVRYPAPGVYTASLAVGNGTSSDTVWLKDVVTVLPSECDLVDPLPGGCATLNDPDDFISLGVHEAYTDSFTFSAWVLPNGIQPLFSAILCTDALNAYQGEIGMQIVADSNEVGYLWKDGHWWWKSGLRLKPDTWNHVGLIVDGNNGITVMVNGQASRYAHPAAPQDLSQLRFVLGTYHYWSTRNLNAQIDEVRLFSKALTVDELRRSMHHPISADDARLLAWYQFNESGGTAFFDVARGHHATPASGSRRTSSTIPYGSGVTVTIRPPTGGQADIALVSANAYVTNANANDTLILTKIASAPPGLVIAGQQALSSYYIAQTSITQPHKLIELSVDLRGLIGWHDARTRTFHLWKRDAYDMNSSWQPVVCTAQHDANAQVIRFTSIDSTPARAMFGISVEGGPVSVPELHDAGFSMWPVPAFEHVTLRSPTSLGIVEIHTMVGETVRTVHCTSESTTINVQDLPAGTYILRSGNVTALLPVVR